MKKEEKRILSLHPEGKKGVNISLEKYACIRDFILRTVRERKEIRFDELTALAHKELSPTFDGRISWYIVTVKLDLEARKFIERVPKYVPQRLRPGTEGR